MAFDARMALSNKEVAESKLSWSEECDLFGEVGVAGRERGVASSILSRRWENDSSQARTERAKVERRSILERRDRLSMREAWRERRASFSSPLTGREREENSTSTDSTSCFAFLDSFAVGR